MFAAYSTAIRQCTLFSGASVVLMAANQVNPASGSSDVAFSVGEDRILARAAAWTPVPAASTWRSPASSRLSMSFAFMFIVMVILLASCLAFGSVDAFQFGFGTRVSCLFSW